jgi:OPT family oligopeptide transporter
LTVRGIANRMCGIDWIELSSESQFVERRRKHGSVAATLGVVWQSSCTLVISLSGGLVVVPVFKYLTKTKSKRSSKNKESSNAMASATEFTSDKLTIDAASADDKPRPKTSSEELSASSSAEKQAGLDATTRPSIDQDDDTAVVEEEAHDNSEIAELPLIVRQTVSLEDDPTLSTITFRYFVLAIFFVVPGAFLSQMSHFRTTQAPYSIFFVQVACHYAGHFLANYLPAWQVKLPFGYGFNLNPAPWSIKEHVLVTLTAASGANYNLGFAPISMAELWYDTKINPAVAIFFMLAIVWVGYAVAAIARTMLLWEPEYIWPQALMQTMLFETFKKQDRQSPLARRQMIIFFSCLVGMTLWQFLPEYVFPMTSSLAFLCWVAPKNPVANFIGSGLGGMGFMNLSLDWSNINWNGSSILITPFWTQVILFLAFAFNCWVLLPAAKWGNLGSYKHGLMTNSLLTANGTKYPTLSIINKDFSLNETAYEEIGPVYMGLQNIWATFFSYTKLPSAFVWMATFGASGILGTFKKVRLAQQARKEATKEGPVTGNSVPNIHHQYTDRLNVLQRSYQEVPAWWFITLFVVGTAVILAIVGSGNLFIPVWTVFVAIATGVVVVIPLGYLYAVRIISVRSLCETYSDFVHQISDLQLPSSYWRLQRAGVWVYDPDQSWCRPSASLRSVGIREHLWRRLVPSADHAPRPADWALHAHPTPDCVLQPSFW